MQVAGLVLAAAAAVYMLAVWLFEPVEWGGWLTTGDYDRGWR